MTKLYLLSTVSPGSVRQAFWMSSVRAIGTNLIWVQLVSVLGFYPFVCHGDKCHLRRQFHSWVDRSTGSSNETRFNVHTKSLYRMDTIILCGIIKNRDVTGPWTNTRIRNPLIVRIKNWLLKPPLFSQLCLRLIKGFVLKRYKELHNIYYVFNIIYYML